MTNGEIRNKLQQLGDRFLVRTLGELPTLRELIAQARSGDAAPLAELRHLAHRMHGTGSTLGFPDIGERAGRIERLTDVQPCDFDAMSACAAEIDALTRAAAAKAGVSP